MVSRDGEACFMHPFPGVVHSLSKVIIIGISLNSMCVPHPQSGSESYSIR